MSRRQTAPAVPVAPVPTVSYADRLRASQTSLPPTGTQAALPDNLLARLRKWNEWVFDAKIRPYGMTAAEKEQHFARYDELLQELEDVSERVRRKEYTSSGLPTNILMEMLTPRSRQLLEQVLDNVYANM